MEKPAKPYCSLICLLPCGAELKKDKKKCCKSYKTGKRCKRCPKR